MQIYECLKNASYKEATIVPRGFSSKAGLYDKNGEYVKYSGKRQYGTDIYVFDDEGLREKEVKYIEEKVYYLGDLRCHYGHFLIDEASRLGGGIRREYGCPCCVFSRIRTDAKMAFGIF